MTLSVVVFPDPVPPEMTMFRRPMTQALRKSRTGGGDGAEGDEVGVGERVLGELADREHRSVERNWGR